MPSQNNPIDFKMHLYFQAIISTLPRGCWALLLLVLLSSCASDPYTPRTKVEAVDVLPGDTTQQQDTSTPYNQTEYQDQALSNERAIYFEQLAENQSADERINTLLSAAEYYVQAGSFYQAEDMLTKISDSPINQEQQNRFDIVNAYIIYDRGDYPLALQVLDSLLNNPANLNQQSKVQRVDALLLSSFCYQKLGNYEAAINSVLIRESLLVGPARTETTRYAWQLINQLSVEQKQIIISSTGNTILRNRVQQSLQGQFSANTSQPNQFEQWREIDTVREYQLIDNQWNQNSPKKIAVLLPLNSKFNKAAQAVMDGIKYQHEANLSSYKPSLDFYDVGNSPYDIGIYYNAAVQSGADMIIGPIGMEYANYLSEYGLINSSTPTILLGGNSILDSYSSSHSSRLTMSPERDSVNVANYAKNLGFINCALLVPNTTNGQRASDAFTQHWLNNGGNIAKTITYSPQQFDHSVELKKLFNINQSEYRYRKLSDTLGYKPKYDAYRRADIDFIFMLSNNQAGRILRPQINFYGGKRVPVIANSSVFNGIQNKEENLDLDNTIFPVMPWVLKSVNVSQYAGQLNMLFAIGTDAYQLAANHATLKRNPNLAISGNMGQLNIDQSGEVIYKPLWAGFSNGIASANNVDIKPIQRDEYPGQRHGRARGGAVYDDSNWDARSSSRKTRE